MKKAFPWSLVAIATCFALLMDCNAIRAGESDHRFSFAVLSDSRSHGDTWKNALLEMRGRKANQAPVVKPAELIVAAGDIDPLESRYNDFLQVFRNAGTRPIFFPVIGNHEFENDGAHFRYARDILIPSIPRVVRRHATSCDYYLDHKNARIIAVDGYTDLGQDGVISDQGRQWAEQVIKATPPAIEHIFISFHAPAFPRFRHVGESFDQDPARRNAFWRMLLAHRDRVRAVFVGHTHSYYRLRIADPAGSAANDPAAFPNEDGGIYQVDAGAAGNGSLNTIVQVQIEGSDVLFRIIQAENGENKPFTERDKWSIVHHP